MKEKYASLQWYRAAAAVLVLLYHFRNSAFQSFFSFGWAGVDLFFVLSGYIITYVHYNDLKQRTNLTTYLKKRAIRIYPVYWIIATIVLLGAILLTRKAAHPFTVDVTSARGIWYLVKCYLLIPQKEDYFLLQAWTLVYELMFYLVFFIAIAIGIKKSKWLLLAWIALILANAFFIKTTNPYFNMLADPIILEFIMGVLVAYYIRVNGFKNIPNWLFITLILALLAALTLNHTYFPVVDGKRNLAFIIAIGLLASVLLFKLTYLNSRKAYKLGLWGKAGEASYTIYLIHPLLLDLLSRALHRLHLQSNSVVTYGITIAALMILMVVMYVFYLLVEVPVLAFLGNVFLDRKTKTKDAVPLVKQSL